MQIRCQSKKSTTGARDGSEKFSWSYWEFCSGFGLYDLAANQWNNELVRASIPSQ